MIITAAVNHADMNGKYTVEQIRIDEPRDDEILVRTLGVGLCHTDLAMASRKIAPKCVFGHEGAGIVEKVGSRVTAFKPGDRVVSSFRTCGACPACLSGNSAYCSNFNALNTSGKRKDGSSTLFDLDGNPIYGNFFGQSCFASHYLCIESNLVKVEDEDLPLEIFGTLGCGVQTGAGTVMNTLNCRPGSSIAVYGAGAVGLSSIMAAKVVGCTKIIAVDIHQNRLDLALELGATHVVNSKEEDPVAAIMKITGSGANYAIDTTGVLAISRKAIECTNVSGGQTAFIGIAAGELVVDYLTIARGRKVTGVMEGDAVAGLFIPILIDLYKQGRLPFDKLVKRYPLSEINQAMEDMHTGVTIKPILIP